MASHAISSTVSGQREERVGLIVAVVLHVALLAVLLWQPREAPPAPVEERMTVSLAEDVGLEAASPAIVRESRAAQAPELSDLPEPPAPSEPEPRVAPPVEPAARAQAAPSRERPQPRERARAEQRQAPAREAERRASASRIGSDFLAGSGSSANTSETRAPASRIGPREQASIVQAITRQLKPHWSAPQGVDSDKLVTVLSWRLNRDGSLAGRPTVVSQSGVTDANAAQKALHAERAVRAVQLASPFDLPEEYYDAWKSVTGARFDRSLSQ